MKIKKQIIAEAEDRGAKNVKVNVGKTGVSLSVNGLVRMTGFETGLQEIDLIELLLAVTSYKDLSWMNDKRTVAFEKSFKKAIRAYQPGGVNYSVTPSIDKDGKPNIYYT